MQAQVSRPETDNIQVTLNQSLMAAKTLLNASFGCILFLRELLPPDNFSNTYLVVGDNSNSMDPSDLSSSQTSIDGRGRSSRFKIMTVKRGFSREGDDILDYVEKGVYDALEKQYIKRLVFAMYADTGDRQNILEAWNFDFSYPQVPGTEFRVPMLSMMDGLSPSSQTSKPCQKEINAPNLGEVKGSIRDVVRKLIAITQTLEDLPRKRYATFKIEYYPHTPDEYEPPRFMPAPEERREMLFSTHDVSESPVRVRIGKVETGYNNVTLEVHSIAGALPTASTLQDKMHIIGLDNGLKSTHTISDRPTESQLMAEDASRRNIVWDVDINEGDIDVKAAGLRGQRIQNGSIHPVGRYITGREEARVENVDLLDLSRSSDIEETQPNNSSLLEATHPESSIQNSPLSSAPGRSITSTIGFEQEVADTMRSLTIRGNSFPKPEASQNEIIDLETQQVPGSWSSESESIPQAFHSEDLEKQVSFSQAREQDEPDETEAISCDCAINEDAEDYDICKCEGPCGRWVHLWCHGYHSSKDHRLPEMFKCFECRLRDTQASVVAGESSIKEYLVKYAELALFRRALKIIEVTNPANATDFRKRVGCTPQVATQLWKRLENEGFIGPEVVKKDSLDLLETRSASHKKSRVRKTAKTKYTKNPDLAKMYAAYFDPSEEMERNHVGIGRKSRNKGTEQNQKSTGSQVQHRGRVLFSTAGTKTQPVASHVKDEPRSPHKFQAPQIGLTIHGKRKVDQMELGDDQVRTPLRRSKRVKISIAQKDVDLEW